MEESQLVHLSHPPTGGCPDYSLLVGTIYNSLWLPMTSVPSRLHEITQQRALLLCGTILCTLDSQSTLDNHALCGVVFTIIPLAVYLEQIWKSDSDEFLRWWKILEEEHVFISLYFPV